MGERSGRVSGPRETLEADSWDVDYELTVTLHRDGTWSYSSTVSSDTWKTVLETIRERRDRLRWRARQWDRVIAGIRAFLKADHG